MWKGFMIEFKIVKHDVSPHRQVVELWDGPSFIGTLTSVPTGNVVRFISKHPIKVEVDDPMELNVVQIHINHPGGN